MSDTKQIITDFIYINMSTSLEKIAGQGGFDIISDTSAHTSLDYESIVVNSACVFSALEINDISVLASKGLSGVTILAGMYLPTNPNFKITKITLASGSIICYK